jgi:phosphoenolpyruvate synthase/pyruvate phosphate dikinase
LVDGAVEPDRWHLYRKKQTIKEHIVPKRKKFMAPEEDGANLKDLPPDKINRAPLGPDAVSAIYGEAKKLEEFFGKPQDVEWTKVGRDFFILQSRPVTARQDGAADDKQMIRGAGISVCTEAMKILKSCGLELKGSISRP